MGVFDEMLVKFIAVVMVLMTCVVVLGRSHRVPVGRADQQCGGTPQLGRELCQAPRTVLMQHLVNEPVRGDARQRRPLDLLCNRLHDRRTEQLQSATT